MQKERSERAAGILDSRRRSTSPFDNGAGAPLSAMLPSAGADISAVEQDKTGWVSFMAWSGIFCLREDFTDFPTLKAAYSHPYAVTKDRLPVLY